MCFYFPTGRKIYGQNNFKSVRRKEETIEKRKAKKNRRKTIADGRCTQFKETKDVRKATYIESKQRHSLKTRQKIKQKTYAKPHMVIIM